MSYSKSINSAVYLKFIELKIDWSQSNGFEEPLTEPMNKYLKDFGTKFIQSVSTLVNKNMENGESNDEDLWFNEILHHALFCNNLVRSIIEPDEHLKSEVIKFEFNDDGNMLPSQSFKFSNRNN